MIHIGSIVFTVAIETLNGATEYKQGECLFNNLIIEFKVNL